MKNRECFESYRDYVEYLERRVRFLERRLHECRNERKAISERKSYFTEMAQPLHRKVCLLIPLPNNPPCDPLEITFVSRTTSAKGNRHHYIDMSDYASQTSDEISKQVNFPESLDSETSVQSKIREMTDLNDFADQIAREYGKNMLNDMQTIKNAIISCYNKVVVDHNARTQNKIPNDVCFVKCDTNGNIVPR